VNKLVIDSSAILALIFREKGSEAIAPLLPGSLMSAVNVAEVFSKLSEKGLLTDERVSNFYKLELNITDFDTEQSRKAAELRGLTMHLGLSLGDRCCLALAILQNATAITTDRTWEAFELCPVRMIDRGSALAIPTLR